MQKFVSWISLLVVLALILGACAQPVPIAPDEAPAAASGDKAPTTGNAAESAPGTIIPGGTWTRLSSADASNLNAVLISDAASGDIAAMIYPSIIGQDPVTGELVPEGSLSESWNISEDGLTYTFHLRDNIKWSDGDPVDAADFKYTYDAIASDAVETPRKYALENIESIEVVDPLTIVVKYSQVKCDALGNLGLPLLPSHLYAADFSDVMESPDNEAPRVSAGPFLFQSWTRDDNTVLVRNDTYWEGAPYMDGMIFKVVPDPGARLAQLQSGEADILGLQPEQITAIEGNPDLVRARFQRDSYDYIGLNLANPENPQPGQDENGNLIEQEPHPILGDVRVRQAIAHSLDYASIIDNVYLGEGYQLAANVLPAVEWAHDPTIQPYTTDLEKAQQLLEEAGWMDGDGDGIREKDGKTLTLRLVTNAGNTVREDLGVLVKDQMGKVGFEVNFEAIDFGTLLEQMDGQTFDMFILGWRGLGTDPNDDAFWHTKNDIPGSGFNAVSYHNPKLDELLEQGYSVPGCKPEDRAPIYKQIQQIIHDDVPYVFISGGVANLAYSSKWGNVQPERWGTYYNVHQWYLKSIQQ
jgi:peptide/nickel transport system substrate-binding protein